MPFDPLSFLGGAGGLPSLTGGDAGPATSAADFFGSVNPVASISAPFVIGQGNQTAGGGAPGGAGAGGLGALTSSNLVFIAGIGAVAWLILTLRRR